MTKLPPVRKDGSSGGRPILPARKDVVVPWGIFGAGNIGDEAMLQGFARIIDSIEQPIRVRVGSRNPRHDARVVPSLRYFKVSRLRRQRRRPLRTASHALVVGDTPITDVLGTWPLRELVSISERVEKRNIPLGFIGVGTEPLADERSRSFVKTLLARARAWSVRSERDRERLQSLGGNDADITVASDLAWLVPAALRAFGEEQLERLGIDPTAPVIGVSLHPDPRILAQEPGFFRKIGGVLQQLIQEGNQLLMLPNEIRKGEDRFAWGEATAHLADQERVRRLPHRYWAPEQMLSVIACCDTLVGMRYHACLFAAVQNVPFVALSRQGKLDDLCWELGWDGNAPAAGSTVSEILELIDRTRAGSVQRTRLAHGVAPMIDRAWINATVLQTVLSEP